MFVWFNQEWNKGKFAVVSFATCVPTISVSRRVTSSGYGTATTDSMRGEYPSALTGPNSIPIYDQTPGNPLKIATPDAAGLLIAQFYPDPTTGGNGTITNNGNNWASPIDNPLNWSEWNVRTDYDMTKKHRVTFRWTQDSWDNPAPNNGSSGFWE